MSALHLEIHGSTAELCLDNPAKLNALTVQMLQALESHCTTIEKNHDIRAVLLTGEGDRAFCVGADINAWADLPSENFARHWVRDGHRAIDRLAHLSLPTIAVISGHAFGGGLELASACDLRVMSPDATLALPETGVGIVAGWSGSQRLAKHFPPAVLKEMALLGRRLTAERAYQIGYANEVALDAKAAAFAMADEISGKSPRATEVTKYMIQAVLGENSNAMIEALGGGMIFATEDKAEGVASFREKRKPKFPGK
ncbi:enoyl-CoA hydratase/isomerase family protein [Amylibacter sp.]|jgi:enoyl-CoA hydratase/carnithine racemase|nr:enoyl-CoA hydratase/isomerase family protein [Amylibacter sp.]|tara:strand:+ start:656 stop:1423 length:768 start_codon:yes stop_codon:yes gene_type:complete